ncbi:uncharacterized protein LOC117920690 [Vitis riparia]|uniref:uncharacterized protein LOC117920690 n=1 Tax=Vitis riparia TaxID=96939 RepID=UPI00155AAA3F|nr:uncharacterized protein LOC117920690 [Vitis riparia]
MACVYAEEARGGALDSLLRILLPSLSARLSVKSVINRHGLRQLKGEWPAGYPDIHSLLLVREKGLAVPMICLGLVRSTSGRNPDWRHLTVKAMFPCCKKLDAIARWLTWQGQEQLWMILHFSYAKRERNSFWKSPTCVVAELLLFLFAEVLFVRPLNIFVSQSQIPLP